MEILKGGIYLNLILSYYFQIIQLLESYFLVFFFTLRQLRSFSQAEN